MDWKKEMMEELAKLMPEKKIKIKINNHGFGNFGYLWCEPHSWIEL